MLCILINNKITSIENVIYVQFSLRIHITGKMLDASYVM